VNKVAERAKSLLFEPGETLSQRVVRGGFWVFALRITNRLFHLIRTIVLARVLAPSDFGLMGIALLTMSALQTFTQTGFQAALIQKKGDIRDYLDTAWTISALRGLVLFAILFLAAPYIALFFATPAATPIMRVIGVSMLLNGLANIGVIYFQKELEFNKQFIYQLSGTLADLVVAITAALLLRNVWALVFGLLARNLVRFVMSYLIHPYRPRMRLEAGRAKELYGFGRWVLASSVIVFFSTQGDDILVGRVLSATALGFYQMAYRLSNLPATEITHVISQVTFPTYSKLQTNSETLRTAYTRVLQLTSLLSFPIAVGIIVVAQDFTLAFLGERWTPMIPAMQVLSIYGLLRSVGATIGPILRAIGKPRLDATMQFIQLCLMTIIIYPLTTSYNILGTSIAVVVPFLIIIWVGLAVCARNIGATLWDLLSLLGSSLLISASMMMVLLFLKYTILNELPSFPRFLTLVTLGLLLYLGLVWLLQRERIAELKQMVLAVR